MYKVTYIYIYILVYVLRFVFVAYFLTKGFMVYAGVWNMRMLVFVKREIMILNNH